MLTQLSLAPIAVLIIFIINFDKKTKEPFYLMFTAFFFGGFIVTIVLPICAMLENTYFAQRFNVIYRAYISSALLEELFKAVFLYFLSSENRHFNRPFDFIIYSCLISLGFASSENLIYVYHPILGGVSTAVERAIFSVPGHFLFGITMGYYYAGGKNGVFKKSNILPAFAVSFLLHGIYNNIVISAGVLYLLIFTPYMYFLWKNGLKKMLVMQIKSNVDIS